MSFWIRCWSSAGSVRNCSGSSTPPSRVGASAMPMGVRTMARPFSRARSCTRRIASSRFSSSCFSRTARRVRYSSPSKTAGMATRSSSTSFCRSARNWTARPGGSSTARGRWRSSKLWR
ncbi:MAG TPA: hypothetical protein VFI16_00545 [Anaeromyxobacteraceae bacterium]|nr:hypothetical protein [Anaeromyxobacteraceae bacterium]